MFEVEVNVETNIEQHHNTLPGCWQFSYLHLLKNLPRPHMPLAIYNLSALTTSAVRIDPADS